MRTYGVRELRAFLVAVDQSLSQPVHIVLIGGSAAALAYGFDRATRDIDTWTSMRPELLVAFDAARESTGLPVPVEHVPIADAPHDFEDRMLELDIGTTNLKVSVPEKHDLTLMKITRGYTHDLDAIAAIHENHKLDVSTLLERYTTEMTHVIRDPDRLDLSFLAAIQRVMGDSVADRAEEVVKRWRSTHR